MKRILVLAVLAVVIVIALAACTEEECSLWEGWGLVGCEQFTSPLAEPAPPRVAPPTATPVCAPELKSKDGIFTLEWNCQ